MKVLHIGKYFPPFSGGIENFMGELLPLLVSSGNQIHALVHNHKSTLRVKTEEHQQVKVIRVPSYGRLLYTPVSPGFLYYLQREISTFQPDIIHIHMPNPSAFWLLLLPSAQRIPWIIHWHSDVVNSDFNRAVAWAYKLYSPFEQFLLKKSRQIIATSPHYLDTSLALKQWQLKSVVIPLGLNIKPQKLSEKALNQAEKYWDNNQHRLLSVGRLTYYKGHQYLIRAVQDIPEAKLIIIGHGELHNELMHLIKQLKLAERVTLAGKLDDSLLHAMMSTCDVFCLPSIERTEAFGLVLLEAMNYAKPLIVSNIAGSGMTWVCQNQQTGLFAQPTDSHDLKEKIESLLHNRNLCQQYGDKGKERLKKEYSLENVAEKTLELYSGVKENFSD